MVQGINNYNMEEIWKVIDDTDGKYLVSNKSRIKSLSRGRKKILKNSITGQYQRVSVKCNGTMKVFRVHRLVAIYFIPNPENKPQVNHINGIKIDNRLENLEWCTDYENRNHAAITGLMQSGEAHYFSKLNPAKVIEIRSKYKHRVYGYARLAREYSVSSKTIYEVIKRMNWKRI